MVEQAMTNIAWRYALRELNAFVIEGVDYAPYNTDGSLDLYDPATGQGAMTEAYLADRAAMLTWKIRFDRGMQDDDDAAHEGPKSYTEDWDTNAVQGNWDFVDLGTTLPGGDPLTLQIDGQGITLHDHQVVFGSNANETIEGAGDTDRLYGGAGNDTIQGLDGADYIEGNAGDDRLDGGEGADRLLGGAGDDTLIGGEGNDTLQGGTGADRYEFSGSFGEDLVVDSDGNGTVWINEVQLKGGKKIEGLPNSWISDDKRWRYELGSNGDLLIRRSDGSAGSVLLSGWQNGGGNRLGIALEDAPPPTPEAPTLRIYLGDQAAPLTVNSAGEPTYDWGATSWLANGTLSDGVAEEDFADVIRANLIDPATDTRIFGYGGNDALGGADGDDEIDGGAGDDLIAGGKGSNTLRGGAGNDFISASGYIDAGQRVKPGEAWSAAPTGTTVLGSGPTWGVYETALDQQTWVGVSAVPTDVSTGSVIDAGEGNDGALGSWAGDTIYMGAGNDLAQGLAGRDVIYGQDGDDRLYGDGIDQAGLVNYVPGDQHGDDLIDGGAGNDSISGQGGADVLLGGAGNDKLAGDGGVRAQFHGADNIDGGLGSDILWGDGASDQLLGGEGDDMLWGDNGHGSTLDGAWHGDDTLRGGAGNDGLIGGGGKDRLFGGEGNDELFGDDVSTVVGGYAVDVKYHGADTLNGGAGDDYMVGGGGADRLYGEDGNDTLYGDGQALAASAHGNDILEGGAGNDFLYGEGGNDTLDGGSGVNRLEGGAGNDTYIVQTADVSVATPQPGQPLLMSTVIKDSEGTNRIRPDATLAAVRLVAEKSKAPANGSHWLALA
jgi:Ca2+-binding RTX toxin-like protein